ncbi:hypothetical protein [Streptomyces rubradiris]|uniref:Uncharacterized protein n=1 Tax=Streptomyces rubradiris TaxID=285531 RepID=A0ABQ3RAA8_STRRR|nr:hypothetical protein [Streptomyces rubradiris]GHH25767.1 hypothetical protein GCM10018792_65220 [Streptomyces rubradiris]GHI52727.1 hypothetical protein Srubr_25730 [Streptomyces rubradiris]
MTITTPETLVSQEADLLARVRDLLAAHPAGSGFRLLAVQDEVPVGEGEVIVQEFNPVSGVVELRGRKLTEVNTGAVLHAARVIDPNDQELVSYAQSPQATVWFKSGKDHLMSPGVISR